MKERDIYHPGVSENQVKQAEKLLGSLSSVTLSDKRSSSNFFSPGVLVAPEQTNTPFKVLVSTASAKRPNERTLLTAVPIQEFEYCELVIELAGAKIMLKGRVEASRPGLRMNDQQQEKPVNISIFHEN